MQLDTPTPSVAFHLPPGLLNESGPSNSPEFCRDPVFTGTPISQPTPIGPTTTRTQNPDGMVTVTTRTPAMDTLASGAGTTPLPPRFFPPGKKLPKKKALSENADLSIFDILNMFRRRWFLSVEHLRAQALSAQKAEDGTIFWVEYSPQFHAHLVKCTVALVPQPIAKVKKLMFMYILELLNVEGPRAFFNLSKGLQLASQAQKEKK